MHDRNGSQNFSKTLENFNHLGATHGQKLIQVDNDDDAE